MRQPPPAFRFCLVAASLLAGCLEGLPIGDEDDATEEPACQGAEDPGCFACAGGALCEIGELCLDQAGAGPESCVDACAEGQRCGDSACCAEGASCVEGACRAPDLTVTLAAPRFSYRVIADDACEIGAAGAAAGKRALLSFELAAANDGVVDLSVDPETSPLFADAPCGDDERLALGFVAWRVKALDGATVADGLLDVALPSLPAGQQGRLAVAAHSVVDVTDVPAGDYLLEVALNPTGALLEASAANNTASLQVPFTSLRCDGVVCGGACCPAGSCEDNVCMLADLSVDGPHLTSSAVIQEAFFGDESCAVFEGCVTAPGARRLLRFGTLTPNLGNADLFMGQPNNNPLFHFSDCHRHYHFDDYASYRLLRADGSVAATGHKQAFCLIDLVPRSEDAGPARYDCSFQGISKGWGDEYAAGLDCQWIDITGVEPGDYTLEVSVNPKRVVQELDYTNNIERVPVSIPVDPNACVPRDEVCGDGVDQNCDDVPDDGCPPLEANDTCRGAQQLAGSGLFTGRIEATDTTDVTSTCGGAGGALFFRFDVPTDGIVYLSTYGSELDTVLTVYQDNDFTCALETFCVDDGCGDLNAHFAGTMTAGVYVAVVRAKEQGGAGLVKLKVQQAGCLNAERVELGQEVTGDTSFLPNETAPRCVADNDPPGGDAGDQLWYFTTCPGETEIVASTCGGTTNFDTAIELREGACLGDPVPGACNDDGASPACSLGPRQGAGSLVTSGLRSNGAGDGLWFVLVDGYNEAASGSYTLGISEAGPQ